MNEKLSIVVPVYNAEKYLSRCLDSLISQTYENLEIIVVDDGSSDNSPQICDEYAHADKRVSVIHVNNGGPSKARNIGLKNITGRYLTFVDADDYLDAETYSIMIKEMTDSNVQMVVCNWFIHNEDTGETSISEIGKERILCGDELAEIIIADDFLCGGGFLWNRIIDTSIIHNANGFPVAFSERVSFYEDKIWLIELVPLFQRIKLVNYIGYHYTIHKSLSHRITVDLYHNMIEAWTILESIATKPLGMEAQNKRDRDIVYAIWSIYKCKALKIAAEYYGQYRSLFIKKKYLSNPKNILKTLLLELNANLKHYG